MDSARLEAFSDGVFAVAITLLALELALPNPELHESLLHQLGDHWPSVAAYVVSFLTIGIIWVNHHALFRNIADVDRPLLFLNLLLLFFVVSIPFVTTMIADYLHHGGSDARVPGAIWASVIRFGIGNIAYLAAVGIAFASPAGALLISGLVAVYYMFEQTPARRGGPGTGAGTGQDADPGQQLGAAPDTGTGRDPRDEN